MRISSAIVGSHIVVGCTTHQSRHECEFARDSFIYLHRSVIDQMLFRSVDKLGPIEVDIGVRIFKSIRALAVSESLPRRIRSGFAAIQLQPPAREEFRRPDSGINVASRVPTARILDNRLPGPTSDPVWTWYNPCGAAFCLPFCAAGAGFCTLRNLDGLFDRVRLHSKTRACPPFPLQPLYHNQSSLSRSSLFARVLPALCISSAISLSPTRSGMIRTISTGPD